MFESVNRRTDALARVPSYKLTGELKIGFHDQLSLNAGQKYGKMLPLGAFCNTFDLH